MIDLYVTRAALIVTARLLNTSSERRSPLELARDGGLLEMWSDARPEVRRTLILQAAWETRGRFTGEADDDAARYAGFLADAAALCAEGGYTWDGFAREYTPAFCTASSLALDWDDLETALATTLLLWMHIPGRQV